MLFVTILYGNDVTIGVYAKMGVFANWWAWWVISSAALIQWPAKILSRSNRNRPSWNIHVHNHFYEDECSHIIHVELIWFNIRPLVFGIITVVGSKSIYFNNNNHRYDDYNAIVIYRNILVERNKAIVMGDHFYNGHKEPIWLNIGRPLVFGTATVVIMYKFILINDFGSLRTIEIA